MMTEMFPPTQEELEAMIKDTEQRMNDADSKSEWEYYQNLLDELLEKQTQLLKKKNNIQH